MNTRIIFSIEFVFRNKTYLGIVRVIALPEYTAYHVRVMNARVDKWLYGQHVFRESYGGLQVEQLVLDERGKELRSAVLEALRIRLQNRAGVIEPYRGTSLP